MMELLARTNAADRSEMLENDGPKAMEQYGKKVACNMAGTSFCRSHGTAGAAQLVVK
jgi:hypothetical protein